MLESEENSESDVPNASDNPKAAVENPCSLCEEEIPKEPLNRVNGRPLCPLCFSQIQDTYLKQKPVLTDIFKGLVGGLVGAFVSGIIWALIVIWTGYEIGYLATGVGFIAGVGVVMSSKGKRGPLMQFTSAICALLGLLLAKYVIFGHFFIDQANQELSTQLSYFSPFVLSQFPSFLPKMFSPFDALWILLALIAALKMTEQQKLVFETL